MKLDSVLQLFKPSGSTCRTAQGTAPAAMSTGRARRFRCSRAGTMDIAARSAPVVKRPPAVRRHSECSQRGSRWRRG